MRSTCSRGTNCCNPRTNGTGSGWAPPHDLLESDTGGLLRLSCLVALSLARRPPFRPYFTGIGVKHLAGRGALVASVDNEIDQALDPRPLVLVLEALQLGLELGVGAFLGRDLRVGPPGLD